MFSPPSITVVVGMGTQMSRTRWVSRLLSFLESLKKTARGASEPADFCLGCPGCVTSAVEQEFPFHRAVDSHVTALSVAEGKAEYEMIRCIHTTSAKAV